MDLQADGEFQRFRCLAAVLFTLILAWAPTRAAAAQVMSHTSSYATLGSSTIDVVVEAHPEVWCPGAPDPTLLFYCSTIITIPAGSQSCDICQLLANAINTDSQCVAQGFSATCDNTILTVSNSRTDLCPGAFVCFDPALARTLKMGMDISHLGIGMPMKFEVVGTATGVSPDSGGPPLVRVVHRRYTTSPPPSPSEGTRSALEAIPLDAFAAELNPTPGMTPAQIMSQLQQSFQGQGDSDVIAAGAVLTVMPQPGGEYDLLVQARDSGLGYSLSPIDSFCETLGLGPDCMGAAAVPTLTGYGVVLLAILMLIAATIVLKRRRARHG